MKDRIKQSDWRMGIIALVIIIFGLLALTGRMSVETAAAAIAPLLAAAGIHQTHKG